MLCHRNRPPMSPAPRKMNLRRKIAVVTSQASVWRIWMRWAPVKLTAVWGASDPGCWQFLLSLVTLRNTFGGPSPQSARSELLPSLNRLLPGRRRGLWIWSIALEAQIYLHGLLQLDVLFSINFLKLGHSWIYKKTWEKLLPYSGINFNIPSP